MNNRASHLARSVTTLFVGFLFWSWGGISGWRTVQVQGSPFPHFFSKPLPPAQAKAQKDKAKLELAKRMSDPHQLTKSDVAAAKSAWGGDSAKMLQILQNSSQ